MTLSGSCSNPASEKTKDAGELNGGDVDGFELVSAGRDSAPVILMSDHSGLFLPKSLEAAARQACHGPCTWNCGKREAFLNRMGVAAIPPA
jgi:hypothetical protein